MDDNRLNQLMDEGWKKLNVTLETELPVKKDRKFVYVWLVLAGCILAGLNYYLIQVHPSAETKNVEIDVNQKSKNEIIYHFCSINWLPGKSSCAKAGRSFKMYRSCPLRKNSYR